MQLGNANDEKIIKKKIVSFLANRSLESRDVIDSKIEILGIMTIRVDDSNQVRNRVNIELGHDVGIEYSGRVTMLISSIRVGSESWYRFPARRSI